MHACMLTPLHLTMLPHSLCGPLYNCYYAKKRTEMRKKYGLRGAPGVDCFLPCCCWPCMMCQDANELTQVPYCSMAASEELKVGGTVRFSSCFWQGLSSRGEGLEGWMGKSFARVGGAGGTGTNSAHCAHQTCLHTSLCLYDPIIHRGRSTPPPLKAEGTPGACPPLGTRLKPLACLLTT